HGRPGLPARQGRAEDGRARVSAVLRPTPAFEPMRESDLRAVIEIEESLYEFPWTHGNFRDSLRAGYSCWVAREGRRVIGYAVLMLAAGGAHLLNPSIAAASPRRGHRRGPFHNAIQLARGDKTKQPFLYVRPTNEVGQRLYAGCGFRQVGVRRGYYPTRKGREDALVLALDL